MLTAGRTSEERRAALAYPTVYRATKIEGLSISYREAIDQTQRYGTNPQAN